MQELVKTRDELKELLELEMRKTFNRIAKERYQWGNTNSKCLARMLRKKRSVNYIEKIQNKGEMVHNTKDIARAFTALFGQAETGRATRGLYKRKNKTIRTKF